MQRKQAQRPTHHYPQTAMIMLLACFVLNACGRTELRGETPGTPTPVLLTPQLTPTLSLSEKISTTQAIQAEEALQVATALALAGLTPPPSISRPDARATMDAQDAAQRQGLATAQANYTERPTTPIPIPTFPPPPTPAPPHLGIVSCGELPNRNFDFNDCWAGQNNSVFTFAASGVAKPERTQGLLRVFTMTLDLQLRGHEQVYSPPDPSGLLHIAQVHWPRVVLFGERESGAETNFVFNLLTRSWEVPGPCLLWPLALHTSTLQGVRVISLLTNLLNGSGRDNFGWLSWSGDQSDDALAHSLTAPGDSARYVNPNNPDDHIVSLGDWVRGRPAVANSPVVTAALASLLSSGIGIVAPVWDLATGQGADLRYHVAGFAWVRLAGYNLTNPNTLTLRYWGQASCPDGP